MLASDPDALLLIRRAERVGDPWSGHMALPGGRRDPADLSLLDTAMREAREEVGVELRAADLLGPLDDLAPHLPALRPIAVRPFVFRVARRPDLHPNHEVAAVDWVDLDRLFAPETHRQVSVAILHESRSVPAFVLDEGVVWGLTERILFDLSLVLRSTEEPVDISAGSSHS